MTRRVLAALLALTAVVLLATAVPLGWLVVHRDRSLLADNALASARSVAAVAEERLGDGTHRVHLPSRLAGVAVFGPHGRRLDGDPSVPYDPGASARAAQGRTTERWLPERLAVTVPLGAATPYDGSVTLVRSTEPLEHRTHALELGLAAFAAAALVAAAGLALGLARWVGRPLEHLAGVAARLGGGDLAARAPNDRGPQEVRRLAAEVNAMAGRLQTLVVGSRALLADVSHQLRTPLAALRLRLELLTPRDAEEAVELDGVRDEVARLSRMVEGLLAVARAENVDVAREPVQLAGVVADRLAAWGPVAAERGVTLEADLPPDLLARVTPGHLEQVLDNLVDNALEVCADGGRVQVRGRADGDRVCVVVADDGPGMPPALRATAFRRFATDRSGTTGGTGLGLAVVHRLVTADGGEVRLDDADLGGLAVVVTLPGG